MKKLITAAVVCAAALALSGCGKSDDPAGGSSGDSVEVNADELPLNDASAGVVAAPAPDAGAGSATFAPPNQATMTQSVDDALRNDANTAANNAGSVADAAKAAAAQADDENAKK